ncbi:MAG: DUF2059 domain-containing protein [bacterium]
MKRLTAGLLVTALLHVAPVRADDAQRTALAEELVTLAELQKNFEQSFAMVKQMLAKQVGSASGSASAESNAKSVESANAVYDLVAKEMEWDTIKKDYIALYATTFTEDELQGVIDFYTSPVGKAFVKKQPELMKKSMELNQTKMAEIMPKIQQMLMQQGLKGGGQVPRAPTK